MISYRENGSHDIVCEKDYEGNCKIFQFIFN